MFRTEDYQESGMMLFDETLFRHMIKTLAVKKDDETLAAVAVAHKCKGVTPEGFPLIGICYLPIQHSATFFFDNQAHVSNNDTHHASQQADTLIVDDAISNVSLKGMSLWDERNNHLNLNEATDQIQKGVQELRLVDENAGLQNTII